MYVRFRFDMSEILQNALQDNGPAHERQTQRCPQGTKHVSFGDSIQGTHLLESSI